VAYRLEHDPESGAFYIRVRAGEYHETIPLEGPGLGAGVEVDAEGNVLGFEFLSFAEYAELIDQAGGQGAGEAGVHGGPDFGQDPGAADHRRREHRLAPVAGNPPANHHGVVSMVMPARGTTTLAVGTGADAVGGHCFAPRPDTGEEEHSALASRLHARERLLFVCGNLVVAALDIDNHEGALVLLPQPRADAVLVDLSSTGHDLLF
jgi:uncharacterized protein YuzE